MVAEPWRWAIVPVVLVAVYTDWRWHKIYNWLTFPALALGFLTSIGAGAFHHGAIGALSGGLEALAGFGLTFVVFLLLVLLGGMKAGDLKLMAAVGAWLGWPLAVSGLLYVALAGGLFSLVWAAAHGALGRLFSRIRLYFLAVQGGINPTPLVQESVAPLFPYGVSIAVGTLAAIFGPPLINLPMWRP